MRVWLSIAFAALACTALGWGLVGRTGTVAAVTGCSTAQDAEVGASAGSDAMWRFTAYYATKFNADASFTVCGLDLYLEPNGSPTMGLTAYIYSHDGAEDDPDAVIGTGSASVDTSTLSAGEQAVTFSGMSAAITTGNDYWIVVVSDGIDSSNYVKWHYVTTATPERVVTDADGLGTWSLVSGFHAGKYQLYSQ